MGRTKQTRSFYISEEADRRLSELAERNYTQRSRYLEKLIDDAHTAQMPNTPAGTRRRGTGTRPQGKSGRAP